MSESRRARRSGATLALTAPFDALYAATQLNERAREAAQETLCGDELCRRGVPAG